MNAVSNIEKHITHNQKYSSTKLETINKYMYNHFIYRQKSNLCSSFIYT